MTVLEFTQWLKNFSSNPYFIDRIHCYDARRRRICCKQSIRGQTERKIGEGGKRSRRRSRSRSRSNIGTRGSSRRRARTRASSNGAGPHTLSIVKGDGTEREEEAVVSDCNSRCRTAFNEEENLLYYTTAGHGLPYRRTLRARKIPAPGSGLSGDAGGGGGGGGGVPHLRPVLE